MKAVLGALVHCLADLNKTDDREVRVNKTIVYHNKIGSWVFMVGYLSVRMSVASVRMSLASVRVAMSGVERRSRRHHRRRCVRSVCRNVVTVTACNENDTFYDVNT